MKKMSHRWDVTICKCLGKHENAWTFDEILKNNFIIVLLRMDSFKIKMPRIFCLGQEWAGWGHDKSLDTALIRYLSEC